MKIGNKMQAMFKDLNIKEKLQTTFKHSRIAAKLLFYILVPLATIFLALNIVFYLYSSAFLEKRASLALLSQAKTIDNEIGHYIRAAQGDLGTLLAKRLIGDYFMYAQAGSLDYAEDARRKVEEDWLRVAEEKPEYATIKLINLDGKSVVDIIDQKINYKHFDFSKEDWFGHTLKLERGQSYASPLYLCREHQKPGIIMSRLYYWMGEKKGIGSIHVHVDDFFKEVLEKPIGENGYLYLIDKAGTIVAHKDQGMIGLNLGNFKSTKNVLAGQRGTTTEIDENNEVLMKKAYIPGGIKDLSLVVAQPMSEVMAFGRRFQLLSSALLMATILIVSAITYISIKKFTEPIIDVQSAAVEIAGGNLDKRIRVRSEDEIGIMARAFNQMTTSLKEKIDEAESAPEQLRDISMEMALGLSECFETLRRIGTGDPTARTSEASRNELVRKLEEVVNQTGEQIQKIIEGERELAIGMCECFDVLKRVSRGDLAARMVEDSPNELVAKLGEVVNQTVFALKEFNLDLERKVDQRTEEVKERTAELERAVVELKEVNKELDAFVYSASHDLKEPLRGIETFSRFILDDYWDKLDDEGRDYLKRISASTSRMKNLIDDLLSLSRVTRAKNPHTSVDTQEVVREALKRVEPEIQERGIELKIREDLPVIYGDKVKLTEVFYNLISNAIKYNDKEKPIIEIDCPIPQPEKDEVVVYVKDNGIGIKEEYFDKIFEIFRRLHARDEYGGGTGAGLAIVKRIIDEHHGRIWVESKVGEGTTFYLSFSRKGGG